jgi:phosphohistidine phosphatase SixA
MTLYLVRHASAGVRGRFDEDDLLRPLDPAGHAQALAIARSLEDRPLARLLSSEALRCIQTLEPLGLAVGLEVETHEALLEGTRPVIAVELLRELIDDEADVAVCSHGDVIPPVLSLLAREGTVLVGGQTCDKGAFWEVDVRGRDMVSARYRPGSSLRHDLAST